MKSTYLMTAMTVVLLSTPGCAFLPNQIIAQVDCPSFPDDITRDCSFTTKFIWQLKSDTGGSVLDASKLAIDTSGSNVDILTNSIVMTVAAKHNGVTIGSGNFGMSLVGGSFEVTSPSSLENFYDSWESSSDEFAIGASAIRVESLGPGTTVFETELVYDDDVVGGDSDSWYITTQQWYYPNDPPPGH